MSFADEKTFSGARVVAFESRMDAAVAEMIAKHGGSPLVAPALREVPIAESAQAHRFAERLLAGEFDVVIFLTGVGARFLAEAIETRQSRAQWLGALSRTKVVVRGPKPLAALREMRARVDFQVPEPNTWKELLATIDTQLPVTGLNVAVQEYGAPNPELIAGLRERGASVTTVPVYRWALPEDTSRLRGAISEMIAGRVQVALFTSAQQVVHVLQVAREMGCEHALQDALRTRIAIGSIGPTTSESLRANQLPIDIEPEHPKLGHLIAAASRQWSRSSKFAEQGSRARPSEIRIEAGQRPSVSADPARSLHDSMFLKACRRERTDVTPIWLMRQAGRYMPEYRALRAKVSFLELCKRPELAAEVTITAAERLGVDAAILFADILLILEPLGFDLTFTKGEGPTIHNPIRTATDVDRVGSLTNVEPVDYVMRAVRAIRAGLRADMPLIGFAGAPFTLACYAIEGGSSRHYEQAKAFMYRDLSAWNVIMARLVDSTVCYLNAQIEAGAQALQIFDSWVGNLGPDDYRRYVFPHMQRLFRELAPNVPVIHFGTGTATLLELQRDAGGSVIGLDWRIELERAWAQLGPNVAVQGNLDPAALLGPREEWQRQACRILDQAGRRAGHVFNLGHGILPNTPVDEVRALVEFVHGNRR
jgi:uroporphyrinogen decarboxylase